jgi:DNA polymerase-1
VDAHRTAMEEINSRLGTAFPRSVIKQINFGLIYGMGVQLMADKAGCAFDEARAAKQAVLSIYPGLKDLQAGLKELAREDQPLRTWGGREYHCEPPGIVNGAPRTYEYKMLNVLVQGSAADQTKQAIINYYRTKPAGHQLLLTVHDEVLAAVPQSEESVGMRVLQEAMEFAPFEIPMLSEGKFSITNWAELRPYDEKGVRV